MIAIGCHPHGNMVGLRDFLIRSERARDDLSSPATGVMDVFRYSGP
jgi:hypothetical protein